MLHHIGSAVVKRAFQPQGVDPIRELPTLPWWSALVFLADVILFFPFLLFLDYAIGKVYPALAMVEDESPPAYEPLALDDESASNSEQHSSTTKPTDGSTKPASSSIRSLYRLLRANGGFKANFRGFFCLVAQGILTLILTGIFSLGLGGVATTIARLLASLTLVQFSTAWVHIIITKPSNLHFWSRLPPFKRTFNATWKPVALNWLATEVALWIPVLLAWTIGLNLSDARLDMPNGLRPMDGSDVAKSLCVTGVALACLLFVTIPAHVVLVRVQASLLPADAETIIPFDRSFDGKVEPAVVTGKGYATISEAWSTFTKAAWRRLVFLYVKIFLITIATGILIALVIVPEMIFILMHAKKGSAGGGEL